MPRLARSGFILPPSANQSNDCRHSRPGEESCFPSPISRDRISTALKDHRLQITPRRCSVDIVAVFPFAREYETPMYLPGSVGNEVRRMLPAWCLPPMKISPPGPPPLPSVCGDNGVPKCGGHGRVGVCPFLLSRRCCRHHRKRPAHAHLLCRPYFYPLPAIIQVTSFGERREKSDQNDCDYARSGVIW